MSLTSLDVCNDALLLLGHAALTAAELTANTVAAAKYCNQFLPRVRQGLFERHPWGFATVEEELTVDATAEDYTWDYGYTLPTGFCRAVAINGDDAIEYDIRGGLLWCNEEEVTLRYVADEDDPALWPAQFVELVAAELAARLAMPITGNERIAQGMAQAAAEAFRRATRSDAVRDHRAPTTGLSLADSRF